MNKHPDWNLPPEFHIPGRVEQETDSSLKGPLPAVSISDGKSNCLVYVMGAHVASFKPEGGSDLLWMSPYSRYLYGVPLRGGIPLCFPWFGAHRLNPELALHGFVREREWQITSCEETREGTRAVFSINDDESTRRVWPHSFLLELDIMVSSVLTLRLSVKNTGAVPFVFEDGFHSYFSVSDPQLCSVEGLSGVQYLNRLKEGSRGVGLSDLPIKGPMVHAYMDVPGESALVDRGYGRVIRLRQREMGSLVVWNPGESMGESNPEIKETWRNFVCVEPANCLDKEITLPPGGVHESGLEISVNDINDWEW